MTNKTQYLEEELQEILNTLVIKTNPIQITNDGGDSFLETVLRIETGGAMNDIKNLLKSQEEQITELVKGKIIRDIEDQYCEIGEYLGCNKNELENELKQLVINSN